VHVALLFIVVEARPTRSSRQTSAVHVTGRGFVVEGEAVAVVPAVAIAHHASDHAIVRAFDLAAIIAGFISVEDVALVSVAFCVPFDVIEFSIKALQVRFSWKLHTVTGGVVVSGRSC